MNFSLSSSMPYSDINILEVFQDALPGIAGTFDVYELTAGSLIMKENNTEQIENPVFYLTNFTEADITESYLEIVRNVTTVAQTIDLKALDKEPFVSGVVSLCFALSGIVTGSWMLFLLLLLSSNTIPTSLILANLFHATGYTVMLALLTNYLSVQFQMNFQDVQELRNLVISSTSFILVKSFSALFVYISWIDLMVQMTKYEKRKRVLTIGMILVALIFAFSLTFNFFFKATYSETAKLKAVKIVLYFFNLLFLMYFTFTVVTFAIHRRRFAFHRKTLALAVFSLLTLLSPYAFILMSITTDVFRSWSTYVYNFANLCVIVTVWEWLHSIRQIENRYERSTVLGRRISNDSFQPGDRKQGSQNSSYILKSLNIVEFFSYLNAKLSSQFKKIINVLTFNDKEKLLQDQPHHSKRSDSNQQIMLYEMQPMSTRNSSVQSQDQISDNISFVGDYPQFNVDHRYLRNTPSTVGTDTRRGTPATPDNIPPPE